MKQLYIKGLFSLKWDLSVTSKDFADFALTIDFLLVAPAIGRNDTQVLFCSVMINRSPTPPWSRLFIFRVRITSYCSFNHVCCQRKNRWFVYLFSAHSSNLRHEEIMLSYDLFCLCVTFMGNPAPWSWNQTSSTVLPLPSSSTARQVVSPP